MSDYNEHQRGIDALKKAIEELQAKPDHFTEDEVNALKRVAKREMAYLALGYLAGSARRIVTWVGAFIGMWLSVEAGILQWLAKHFVGK